MRPDVTIDRPARSTDGLISEYRSRGTPSCRPGRWRRQGRSGSVVVLGAAILLGACGNGGKPARIVYPAPWLGVGVAEAAQPVIDAWGRPAVKIPDSLMMERIPAQGLGGEVDFAGAMARMPGVVVAIGPQSSRATLLVARIYANRRIPLIAPTATSHQVGNLGPWIFQMAPDDWAEGEFIVRFIIDRLGARRVTIFYLVADEYGLGLRDGLVQALDRRGLTPVDQVGIVPQTDFARRVAESLERAESDVVVVAARGPEAVGIARALHGRRPSVPVVIGDGAPVDRDFVRAVGAAASSVYAVSWWSADRPDTLSRAFVARFERATGSVPSPTDAMYYDAVMLAAQAVHDVGRNRRAIRRYLSELGTTRPAYQGVTGLIAFGPHRSANLVMRRIDHGEVVTVEDPEDQR